MQLVFRPSVGRRVQTIEKTAKIWKAQLVLAVMLAVIGVVLVAIDIQGYNLAMRDGGFKAVLIQGGPAAVGVGMIILGTLWFAFARAMAWWNHG